MQAESIFLADDHATADFGRRFAAGLRPGDLVLLSGELGAGKTALARAVIRTLIDDPGLDVPSPSFSLVQPYEREGTVILHADLYRLSDPREIDELGLSDRPDAIVLIEWPEQDPDLAGRLAWRLALSIAPRGDGRLLTLEPPLAPQ